MRELSLQFPSIRTRYWSLCMPNFLPFPTFSNNGWDNRVKCATPGFYVFKSGYLDFVQMRVKRCICSVSYNIKASILVSERKNDEKSKSIRSTKGRCVQRAYF